MKTYPQLLTLMEMVIRTGKVTLDSIGLSEIEFEKIKMMQKMLSASQVKAFYANCGMPKDKIPSQKEIDDLLASEMDRRKSVQEQFQAKLAAEKAATDKGLIDTIRDAGLTNGASIFNSDKDTNLVWANDILGSLDPGVTLVFQGGATKGAFQAGALLYLGLHWEKLDIRDVIGASTGSFSGLQVAAFGKESGERLAAHYTTMEPADFNDWSAKYSEVTRVLSNSLFPGKLEGFLEGMMLKYPNRFKAKAIEWRVNNQPVVSETGTPEVVFELLNGGDEEGGGGILPMSSDDLKGMASYISEIITGLSLANLIPGVNFLFSLGGILFADDVEDFVEELIAVYEAFEKLEENAKGLMNSEKIQQAIGLAARKYRESGGEIGFHGAVTSVSDTRVLWVNSDGDFKRDRPHDPHVRSLPEGVLEKGVLASMAYPIMFDPIQIENPEGTTHFYADGGIRENCGIAKAFERPNGKIWAINCSPSPLESWPKGPEADNLSMVPYMSSIVMDMFQHENDLAERHPRIPFPATKQLTQISPSQTLIGLLEADSGCVQASMLAGFLHAQVALYDQILKIDGSKRRTLRTKVTRIEKMLGEMLAMERAMFFEGEQLDKTTHIIKNKTVGVYQQNVALPPAKDGTKYYFCYADIQKLRAQKKKIIQELKAYCALYKSVTNEKRILPEKLGHLNIRDLLVNVSTPLGQAIFQPREHAGTCYEHFYVKGNLVDNGHQYFLNRREKTLLYSNLWGSFRMQGSGEVLIAAEQAPDLDDFREFFFLPAFPGQLPKKPLVHKLVQGPVYHQSLSKVAGNFRSFDRALTLSKRGTTNVLQYGPAGDFALYGYDNGTKKLSAHPIRSGRWANINSKNEQIIHLHTTYYLVYTTAEGRWKVYDLDIEIPQLGNLFDANALAGSGTFAQQGHRLSEKIVIKHPTEHQLIFITPQTGLFEVHRYQVAPNTPLLANDSLVFAGNLHQQVSEKDSFEVLNSKILVQKHYSWGADNFQYKYFHLEIDPEYQSLVHYKPLYVSGQKNQWNGERDLCPIGPEMEFRLSDAQYEIFDSVYRFQI